MSSQSPYRGETGSCSLLVILLRDDCAGGRVDDVPRPAASHARFLDAILDVPAVGLQVYFDAIRTQILVHLNRIGFRNGQSLVTRNRRIGGDSLRTHRSVTPSLWVATRAGQSPDTPIGSDE